MTCVWPPPLPRHNKVWYSINIYHCSWGVFETVKWHTNTQKAACLLPLGCKAAGFLRRGSASKKWGSRYPSRWPGVMHWRSPCVIRPIGLLEIDSMLSRRSLDSVFSLLTEKIKRMVFTLRHSVLSIISWGVSFKKQKSFLFRCETTDIWAILRSSENNPEANPSVKLPFIGQLSNISWDNFHWA